MALDTAAKRFSIGSDIVLPDGTLDAFDRATIAGFYLLDSAPQSSLRIRVESAEPEPVAISLPVPTAVSSVASPTAVESWEPFS